MLEIPRIQVWSATELEAHVFPDEPWLIEPVMRRGDVWLCAGDADSFKSLLLLQLMIHASLGVDYLYFKIEKPVKILYINADDNAREVQERIKKLNTTGMPLNDNLQLICQPCLFLNYQGIEQVKLWVRDYNPDIIIIDHLGGFVEGGTVDQHGMQGYLQLKNWICSQDKSLVSVAHTIRETKENETYDVIRKIAGIGLIKSLHGIITYQQVLEPGVVAKEDRFKFELARNKNMTRKLRESYDTVFKVKDLTNGRVLLQED